jgi:DNA polymerase-4
MSNIFALVDMDAFFTSVEESLKPSLKSKPLVVGRRVVSCSNYIARTFGIFSAMPTFEAIKRCPELIILNGNYKIYLAYSKKLKNFLDTISPYVYQASIDEFYLKLDTISKNYEEAEMIAFEISKKIKKFFKITASIGIAPTLLSAKVASEENKPDGIKIVRPENLKNFLSKTKVEKFPGIGKITLSKLQNLKIFYPEDINNVSFQDLNRFFSKEQIHFIKLLFSGNDEAFFLFKKRKISSISRSISFESPIDNREFLLKILIDSLESMLRSMRLKEYYGTAVELSLRSLNYKWKSKRKKFQYPSRSQNFIYGILNNILESFPKNKSFRGIRLKIDGLTKNSTLHLFGKDKIDYILEQFKDIEIKYNKPLLKTALSYYYETLFNKEY